MLTLLVLFGANHFMCITQKHTTHASFFTCKLENWKFMLLPQMIYWCKLGFKFTWSYQTLFAPILFCKFDDQNNFKWEYFIHKIFWHFISIIFDCFATLLKRDFCLSVYKDKSVDCVQDTTIIKVLFMYLMLAHFF